MFRTPPCLNRCMIVTQELSWETFVEFRQYRLYCGKRLLPNGDSGSGKSYDLKFQYQHRMAQSIKE